MLISTTNGPVQSHVGIIVVQMLHAAVGVLDLHHRPLADEQPRQADGLVEGPTAVAAQIEDHGIDALPDEIVENFVYILGSALKVGLAAAIAAMSR